MPNSVCLDANLVIRLVLRDKASDKVLVLWEEWIRSGCELIAPSLLRYEIANALHRYVLHGEMKSERAAEAMRAVMQMGLAFPDVPDLHQRALAIAQRFHLPAAYDAHYLALAESLGAAFWTGDQRLARAVQGELAWVHLVEP